MICRQNNHEVKYEARELNNSFINQRCVLWYAVGSILPKVFNKNYLPLSMWLIDLLTILSYPYCHDVLCDGNIINVNR